MRNESVLHSNCMDDLGMPRESRDSQATSTEGQIRGSISTANNKSDQKKNLSVFKAVADLKQSL